MKLSLAWTLRSREFPSCRLWEKEKENSRVVKAMVRVLEGRRCSDVEGLGGRWGKHWRRALVTLGEEPECVDLMDEIG